MAKLSEFRKSHQRKIIKEFRKRGVRSCDLKNRDLKTKEDNNRIFVTYGNLTVNIPSPSQGVIDEIVDEFGGVILGVLIGVPVFAVGVLFGMGIGVGSHRDS
ncbi:MAG: hypothetical protein E3K37_02520 [Candidatus Kuenenia sp.]|nr:hypothetical protein [Candidatus Kuenenia hertensis]